MSEAFLQHDDERRTLVEWITEGVFQTAKVVVVKEAVPIGDHFHKNKDEVFFLLRGRFLRLQTNETIQKNIDAPYKVTIPRGTYHEFLLEPGSILLGVATGPFDPADELKPKL